MWIEVDQITRLQGSEFQIDVVHWPVAILQQLRTPSLASSDRIGCLNRENSIAYSTDIVSVIKRTVGFPNMANQLAIASLLWPMHIPI